MPPWWPMSGLDLVPDDGTALSIALPILERYYGSELVDRFRPFRAVELGSEWAVLGTAPGADRDDAESGHGDRGRGGGFPELMLSRRDARVSRIALSR